MYVIVHLLTSTSGVLSVMPMDLRPSPIMSLRLVSGSLQACLIISATCDESNLDLYSWYDRMFKHSEGNQAG